MDKQIDLVVIGGGPAGMMAAIEAAKGGLQVTILEQRDIPGKKILSTGNGRCNFTNLHMGPEYYHSDSVPDPVRAARQSDTKILSGADFNSPYSQTLQSACPDNPSAETPAGADFFPSSGQTFPDTGFVTSSAAISPDTGCRVSSCREISSIAAFTAPALTSFSERDTIAFFHRMGVQSVEKDGFCYPRTMQAGTIRRALAAECERVGVTMVCQAEAEKIAQNPSDPNFRFEIKTSAGTFYAGRCILAAGGSAAPKLGSDGSGFFLAAGLGHTIIPPVPALVPLISDAKWLKSVKGVRAQGRITLFLTRIADDAADFHPSARGELQFTDYGISGIPVFQVSRCAARALAAVSGANQIRRFDHPVPSGSRVLEEKWDSHDHRKTSEEKRFITASIDLLPEFDGQTLFQTLNEVLLSDFCPASAQDLLAGMIHSKLAAAAADWLHAKRLDLRKLSADEKRTFAARAVKKLKDIRLPIIATKDFNQAQVTAGGVSAGEIDPATMESRLIPGLYFAGELIDVDGICGGYNLQWAFSSGNLAGKSAAAAPTDAKCHEAGNSSCCPPMDTAP